MPTYKNKKTGTVINTVSVIISPLWGEIKPVVAEVKEDKANKPTKPKKASKSK